MPRQTFYPHKKPLQHAISFLNHTALIYIYLLIPTTHIQLKFNQSNKLKRPFDYIFYNDLSINTRIQLKIDQSNNLKRHIFPLQCCPYLYISINTHVHSKFEQSNNLRRQIYFLTMIYQLIPISSNDIIFGIKHPINLHLS